MRFYGKLPGLLLCPGFSPQRMNAALQTLKGYGSTEGIRCLNKATDPEIATHLQQGIEKREEND